jgi:D-alanine-D-alanine ligase
MAAAYEWDNRVLVEEFLDGMEFSVILVGNEEVEAFLPTETTTENAFMTYDDKYMPGRSRKITPARVDAETLARIQAEAIRLYRAMGFRGYARLDGFLMPDGRLLFTDPNSTSGMAPSSFMFHQAAEAGLTPIALIDRIISLALEAHAEKRGPL